MSEQCGKCDAKCCKYFCFEIDEPVDFAEFDDIRWFLCHEGVSVHIDEGDWYISIANPCKMLDSKQRCRIYDTRPTICRGYTMKNCDYTLGDYAYDEEFNTPDDIEKYARKTLGEKKYDADRAKAYGLEKTGVNNKKKTGIAKKAKSK